MSFLTRCQIAIALDHGAEMSTVSAWEAFFFYFFIFEILLGFDRKSHPGCPERKSAVVFNGPFMSVVFLWEARFTKLVMHLKGH